MKAIDKFISVAEGELGYLEKKSNSWLDEKNANAGSANYTKYWRDIYPKLQGQPWCACFVTWCLVQAVGKDIAAMMLRHYPYVYCPTMRSLFTLNANPKRGDIVVFYRNGEFAHTGIVTKVEGDYFETIEGNASGASGITPNGGGVVRKHYYNSQLPGTKFVTLNWSLVEEELTMNQYSELKEDIAKLTPMVYNYIDSNMEKDASWAVPTIQKLTDRKILVGNEKGELGLTMDMLKILSLLDRVGIFDK